MKQKGFGLIGLILIFVVIAIVLIIAIPMGQDYYAKKSLETTTRDFVASVHQAQLLARSSHTLVALCPLGNPEFDYCGSRKDWKNGWIIRYGIAGSGKVKFVDRVTPTGNVAVSGDAKEFLFDHYGELYDERVGSMSFRNKDCRTGSIQNIYINASGQLNTGFMTCAPQS